MATSRLMSHCNKCQQQTRHKTLEVIVREHKNEDEFGQVTEWTKTYRMLECCGCEDIQMRVEYWHSDIPLDETDFDYYPPRVSRRKPDWARKLPRDWTALMHEVYGALASDSRRLAVMGARTLIDLYLAESVGDHGSFAQRLDRLVDDGYLARNAKDTLEAALDAGNAAAHRGHTPNASDISLVMDIVENLLHAHVLKVDAPKLKASIPARPPKPAKAGATPVATPAASKPKTRKP